jgi:hypothetical protein
MRRPRLEPVPRPTPGRLALLLALAACSAPDRRYVSVRVTGLTQEMSVLGLEVSVDGRGLTGQGAPAEHPVRRECGEGTDCFVLQLPDGWNGGLRVAVEARGLLALPGQAAAVRALGWGEQGMTLSGTETSIEVPLSRYALWVLARGKGATGKLSIQPAPGEPGACGEGCQVYRVPVGQNISVAAAPEQPDRAYFAGWQGACHGLAPCALAMRGPRALGAAFALKPCLQSGFCWDHPLPQGNGLRAVAVAAPDRAFAVGDAGTVLAWDGATWSLVPSGTGETLLGAAVLEGDLFAVGRSGTVRRCPGAGGDCQPEESRTTRELRAAATGGGVLLLVGAEGTVLERGQAGFRQVPGFASRDLSGVWVAPDGASAYAVGRGGEVHRITRQAGQLVRDGVELVPGQGDLQAVWGDGQGGLYAAGVDGVFRRDRVSGAWEQMGSTAEQPLLRRRLGLFGVGGGAVSLWAVGLDPMGRGSAQRFDGERWQEAAQEAPLQAPPLRGVAGSGAADVWIVGDGGRLAHSRDGVGLAPFFMAVAGPEVTLRAVADGGAAGIFAAGTGGALLRRRAGDGWSAGPGAGGVSLFAAAAGGGLVFAAGEAGALLEHDGTEWRRANAPGLDGTYVWYALAAEGQRAMVAGEQGGGGVIWERQMDGSWALLSKEGAGRGLRGLSAGPAGEFLATGLNATLRYRRTGMGAPSVQMTAVSGAFLGAARLSTGQFLVAGEGLAGEGLILSGDADKGSWVPLALPAGVPRLHAVTRAADVTWAVGAAGAILRREGTGAFAAVPSGVAYDLRGALSTASGLYLVGDGAAVLRRAP